MKFAIPAYPAQVTDVSVTVTYKNEISSHGWLLSDCPLRVRNRHRSSPYRTELGSLVRQKT